MELELSEPMPVAEETEAAAEYASAAETEIFPEAETAPETEEFLDKENEPAAAPEGLALVLTRFGGTAEDWQKEEFAGPETYFRDGEMFYADGRSLTEEIRESGNEFAAARHAEMLQALESKNPYVFDGTLENMHYGMVARADEAGRISYENFSHKIEAKPETAAAAAEGEAEFFNFPDSGTPDLPAVPETEPLVISLDKLFETEESAAIAEAIAEPQAESEPAIYAAEPVQAIEAVGQPIIEDVSVSAPAPEAGRTAESAKPEEKTDMPEAIRKESFAPSRGLETVPVPAKTEAEPAMTDKSAPEPAAAKEIYREEAREAKAGDKLPAMPKAEERPVPERTQAETFSEAAVKREEPVREAAKEEAKMEVKAEAPAVSAAPERETVQPVPAHTEAKQEIHAMNKEEFSAPEPVSAPEAGSRAAEVKAGAKPEVREIKSAPAAKEAKNPAPEVRPAAKEIQNTHTAEVKPETKESPARETAEIPAVVSRETGAEKYAVDAEKIPAEKPEQREPERERVEVAKADSASPKVASGIPRTAHFSKPEQDARPAEVWNEKTSGNTAAPAKTTPERVEIRMNPEEAMPKNSENQRVEAHASAARKSAEPGPELVLRFLGVPEKKFTPEISAAARRTPAASSAAAAPADWERREERDELNGITLIREAA